MERTASSYIPACFCFLLCGLVLNAMLLSNTLSNTPSIDRKQYQSRELSAGRLAHVAPAPALTCDSTSQWIQDIHRHERQIFSQEGEDGVLNFIFSKIGVSNKIFVEFGVAVEFQPYWKEARDYGNYRALREDFGWTGFLFDKHLEDAKINLVKADITAATIVPVFQKALVPKDFDMLSVDTDGNDYWILKSILLGGYRPAVIVVEPNPSHGLTPFAVNETLFYDKLNAYMIERGQNKTNPVQWQVDTDYWGASLGAYAKLGEAHGYRMIYTESTGLNAFMVQHGLLANQCKFPSLEELLRPPCFQFCNYPAGNKDKLGYPPRFPCPSSASEGFQSVLDVCGKRRDLRPWVRV